MGHGNPAVVESLLQQGTITMLELAVKWMRTLGTDATMVLQIAVWCESLTREDALEFKCIGTINKSRHDGLKVWSYY